MRRNRNTIWFLIIIVVIIVIIYFYRQYISDITDQNTDSTPTSTIYTSQNNVSTPIFSDYKVSPISLTKYPKIDLKSNPLGTEYKTYIIATDAKKPNFAGKYSIVTWGCGTACQSGVIIDRESGKILSQLPITLEGGFDSNIDSNLVIFNPFNIELADKQKTSSPTISHYYTWDGKAFQSIGDYIIIDQNNIKKV